MYNDNLIIAVSYKNTIIIIIEKYFFIFQSDVILYVNRLNTEESVIPYEYHHFDFCTADESNSPVSHKILFV
jgi:hypothetical protein